MVGCCVLCKLRRPPPAFAIAHHAIPNSYGRTFVHLESAIVPPLSLHCRGHVVNVVVIVVVVVVIIIIITVVVVIVMVVAVVVIVAIVINVLVVAQLL